jgi:hypothetical protein
MTVSLQIVDRWSWSRVYIFHVQAFKLHSHGCVSGMAFTAGGISNDSEKKVCKIT